jgi:hypothetical protein
LKIDVPVAPARSQVVALRTEVAESLCDRPRKCQYQLQRTKALLICPLAGQQRASVRHLGIEVDDAIEIAEKIDI